jgi:SOS-response transcriptional repressor LexA
MRSEFGERLHQARKRAGLTQSQLSKKAGMAQATLAELERVGTGSSYTPAIADLCGVSVNWLAYGRGDMLPAVNVATAELGIKRVPLISYVQAGIWTEASDPYITGEGSEMLQTDSDISRTAFALEIKGDSMLPEFKPGDRVIIDPEVAPQPGDFVVAKNGDNEATFKKYRPRGLDADGRTIFELVPLNEDYPTLRSDQQQVRIIGTMVEHRKYRRR